MLKYYIFFIVLSIRFSFLSLKYINSLLPFRNFLFYLNISKDWLMSIGSSYLYIVNFYIWDMFNFTPREEFIY